MGNQSANRRTELYRVLACQWTWAILILIAPIGFNLRSRWGLAIEHLILALMLLIGLTLWAAILATQQRNRVGKVLAAIPLILGLGKLFTL